MPHVHFLNVKDGDCNVIVHRNDHVTVIDVCNAAPLVMMPKATPFQNLGAAHRVLGGRSMTPPPLAGDFGQKEFPVNPIDYLKQRDINDVFRFVLTHPDMDHMDGIKAFFEHFQPTNFWDTDNNKTIDWSKDKSGKFNEEDWKFYLKLRQGTDRSTKRLALHSNSTGKYYNVSEDGSSGGDGLHILAPNLTLIAEANEECENYHGCSYVILYITGDKPHKILFGGDSHDDTWDHILKNHRALVTNIDVLIAPHHGRSSDRSYDFLDVLNPALTLFGNAPSEHLAYAAFQSRKLPIITNNQAGCIMLDIDDTINVYVTNKKFAQSRAASYTFASPLHLNYHYLQAVTRPVDLKPPPKMPRNILG
jgi:competence protein ComEC